CFIYPNTNVWSDSKVVVMIGTADNWTRAQPCTELFSNIYRGTGYKTVNKKLYLYDNEYHSFDDINYITELNGTYDFNNCRFHIDNTGKTMYKHKNQLIHIGDMQNRAKAIQHCVEKRNHPTGYNSKMMNDHIMDDFMIELYSVFQPEKLYMN